MDYQKVYNQLIASRKALNRQRYRVGDPDFIYYEGHHILPVCLGGEGKSTQWKTHPNIVLLTAREHYIAHDLLRRIYPQEKKLASAFYFMSFQKQRDRKLKLTSRQYEEARIALKNLASVMNKGRKLTEEQCEAASRAKKGKPLTEAGRKAAAKRRGEKRDPTIGRKISQATTGRKLTLEHRQNLSRGKRGKSRAPHSQQTKINLSKGARNRKYKLSPEEVSERYRKGTVEAMKRRRKEFDNMIKEGRIPNQKNNLRFENRTTREVSYFYNVKHACEELQVSEGAITRAMKKDISEDKRSKYKLGNYEITRVVTEKRDYASKYDKYFQ